MGHQTVFWSLFTQGPISIFHVSADTYRWWKMRGKDMLQLLLWCFFHLYLFLPPSSDTRMKVTLSFTLDSISPTIQNSSQSLQVHETSHRNPFPQCCDLYLCDEQASQLWQDDSGGLTDLFLEVKRVSLAQESWFAAGCCIWVIYIHEDVFVAL